MLECKSGPNVSKATCLTWLNTSVTLAIFKAHVKILSLNAEVNMTVRFVTILALIAVGCGTALADHGNKDKHGKKYDDTGWERRDGYEYHTYGKHDGNPPGWSKGKKTGWGNCGLPPGQAKKYGCQTYTYQGRPHYYYRDEQGRIVVRRPIIEAQGSVLIH
jgi:hypothetical protein